MKSIFVSFDEIGWRCLAEILELGGEVAAIVTLDDERRARMSGSKDFAELAARYRVPLIKTRDVNDPAVVESLRACDPDLVFVVGWSQLVKKEFLSLARYASLGMHPTLLPKHRGRAPIPWAILLGLRKTGVTMFHLKEEADNGAIVGQVEIPITPEDDAGSLYEKALSAHIELVRTYFPLLVRKCEPRIAQDDRRASSWPKRVPADGIIDWNTAARNLHDWVRALTRPYPGAFTYHQDRKLLVWKSKLVEHPTAGSSCGEVVAVDPEGIVVSTGEGAIRLTSVEFEGEGPLHGTAIRDSDRFLEGHVLG